MFKIGCHLSSSKGFHVMGKEAVKIGANTFQYFTRNPRGGAEENKIYPPLAHAPYTLNACANQENLRQFAFNVMTDDLSKPCKTRC